MTKLVDDFVRFDLPALGGALVTKHVRFVPLESSDGRNNMAARLELLGCLLEPEIPLSGMLEYTDLIIHFAQDDFKLFMP